MGKKSLIILGHGVVLDGENSLIEKSLCKVKCNMWLQMPSAFLIFLTISDVCVLFLFFFL